MNASSLSGHKVTVHDMCLRDGMHAKRHQITLEQMQAIARGLDQAGVPLIEVTHGDGLDGSSINYGFGLHTDEEYLRAVLPVVRQSKISCLFVPGIGLMDSMRMAADLGVSCIRVATHCTEADVGEQHIGLARKLGLDAVGFLMMAHMVTPQQLLEQAKRFESYGATCVYVTDSAGYMLPDDVTAKLSLLRQHLAGEVELGFHGHNNLSMSVANSLAAVQAGANLIDGSAGGLGAGAGNTPLESFVAVCQRLGIETGVEFYRIMDVAEDIVRPIMDQPVRVDRDALSLGFAGTYSTFLLHARRLSGRYGIPVRDLLVECGRRKTVAGQEDMIESIALEMLEARNDRVSAPAQA